MEMLSSEYGWTPTQIMEQPFEYVKAYLEIINTKRILEKNNHKKNGR